MSLVQFTFCARKVDADHRLMTSSIAIISSVERIYQVPTW